MAGFTAEEYSDIMERVAREMEQFGRLTQETEDALNDAKVGIKGFSAATRKAGETVTSLGKASTEAAKAMYENKQGAAAFNSSLDEMGKAVTAASAAIALLMPGGVLMKGLVLAVGAATNSLIGLTKAANKMSDDLFKGYTGLAKSGAAASDGMSGVFRGAQKLGLGMDQLGSYVQLVNDNAKDLATFGGTVFEGRKRFEDMGKAMEPYRQQLMAAGYTQEEINDASMQYLRLQTRIGQTQNLTTQQLADGAKKYLFEQEALTKITGMTRQEQEQALEAARSQQRFRAKLEEMRASGDEKQIAAAAEMEATYKMLYKYNKEAAQGFGDVSTGMIGSEAAIKFHMATLGEGAQVADKMAKSQMGAVEGFEVIGKSIGATAKQFNMLAQAGAFEDVFGNFAGAVDLGIAANRNLVEEYNKAREDMNKQRKGADEVTDQYTQRLIEQQKVMLSLQNSVFQLVGKSGELSDTFTDISKDMADIFEDLVPVLKEAIPVIKLLVKGLGMLVHAIATVVDYIANPSKLFGLSGNQAETTGSQGTLAGALSAGDLSAESAAIMGAVEGRAIGGPVSQGKPYVVGEKGPELFVPKNAGEIISSDAFTKMVKISDTLYDRTDNSYKQIIKFNTEILGDTQDLSKIADANLDREKAYSNFLKEYLDTKTQYLKSDLETTKTNYELGSAGGAAAGGVGITGAPSAGGMGMSVGGGQGLKATSQQDLAGLGLKIKSGDVQAEGAGISPQLIQLAQAIQGSVPGFSYFSAFNDKFHNERASSSKHTQGRALDFALNYAPTKEQGAQIVNQLKAMGAGLVIDEYNNPSSQATAGHIHAEIPAYANGGLIMKPQIAMVGERGPEAVVPLDRELIDYKTLASELRNALADVFSGGGTTDLGTALSEMVRLQKESVDTQQRILQVSYN